jgi:hypothetical protein
MGKRKRGEEKKRNRKKTKKINIKMLLEGGGSNLYSMISDEGSEEKEKTKVFTKNN